MAGPLDAQPRDAKGLFGSLDALARFDATTGCVVWTGGTSAGRGNTARYGVFWHDGRRVFPHRWAAAHIHGLPVDGVQVGHCCPGHPNTLCVQHVEPQTQLENLAEQNARMAARRVEQSNDERQHWLFVALGIRQLPDPPPSDADAVPFHSPPAWLRPCLVALPADDWPF